MVSKYYDDFLNFNYIIYVEHWKRIKRHKPNQSYDLSSNSHCSNGQNGDFMIQVCCTGYGYVGTVSRSERPHYLITGLVTALAYSNIPVKSNTQFKWVIVFFSQLLIYLKYLLLLLLLYYKNWWRMKNIKCY